jgi:RNA polymerase sigma factor (sigma-70 family)
LIHAVAARLGFEGADREDLFQEACLVTLDSIDSLRDPRRLNSWVYTIAYRLGIDALRRRRPEIPLEGLSEVEASRPPGEAIEREMERLEEISLLLDAVAQLDQRCLNLLSALHLDDPPLSYAAAAERLGMPIGSIGPTRARCLGRLRALMKKLSGRPPVPSVNRGCGEGPGSGEADRV